MAKTVIGLIENSSEAQKVVDELLQSGFDRKHIGVISTDVLAEASSAISGASAGIAIGGVAGMLLAAVAIAIPGIGPALVAGPALTLLAGTTIGALAGGLIGGLKSRGVPEDEAHFYAEGLRRGGTLLTVYAENDELAARAVDIMKRHGAVDMEERAAQWKKEGWSGRYEDRGDAASAARAQPGVAAGTAAGRPAASDREGVAQGTSGQTLAPEGSRAMRPAAADAPVQAERVSGVEDADLGEPVALSAVQVYSFVIEVPVDETLEGGGVAALGGPRDQGRAANQPTHSGPERRSRTAPYSGLDRRHAA
jgi:hypothetical protein